MTEEMLDVLAVTDKNQEPVYGDCLLQVGEHVLKFTNGRAKVPAELASIVARERNLEIPGYSGPVAEPVPSVVEPGVSGAEEAPAEEPTSEAIALAEEHLRQEGMEVPEREPDTPESDLAPFTADGQPRCQAHKGDGSQCANAAVDGGKACGMAAHRAQFA